MSRTPLVHEAPLATGDLVAASHDVDARAATTLRLLAADAVEAAGSGHPGLPMGMAMPAWLLWSRYLRFDPTCPSWPDRDRFVLSAGHGSMLLYGLLHVFGHDLSLADLAAFRQWGSRTPGHPEHGVTPGVETTTGPLGQGLANAVGMALAERMLAARHNDPDLPTVVDHRTFVIASDGDLMEGISHEAASLAGHLGLGRLVVLYDDNQITIDGPTSLSCSDDACARFAAYGWQTLDVDDTEDRGAVTDALDRAIGDPTRPTLVRVRSRIGYGAPDVEGTAAAHGAPLGPDQLRVVRGRFGWPSTPFHVPDDVRARARETAATGRRDRQAWEARFRTWTDARPDAAATWQQARDRVVPDAFALVSDEHDPAGKVATRAAAGRSLADAARQLGSLVGGSADLAGSTKTSSVDGDTVTRDDARGPIVAFGVREHAMAAACNGIALHGGLRPYASTFTVFSDYARPALRLAALMELPIVHLFTHDSVAVGEDGPTHQPVEHLAALRAIPGLAVLRPADAHETDACMEFALRRTDGPTALLLTRQGLPVLRPSPAGAIGAAGAWVVEGGTEGEADVAIVATGSEVAVALAAADELRQQDLAVRVVSMPWRERFLDLPPDQQASLLPPDVPRVVVEAGVRQGWVEVTGSRDAIVSIDRFGASAPGERVMAELGITPARVVATVRRAIAAAADTTDSAAPATTGGRP